MPTPQASPRLRCAYFASLTPAPMLYLRLALFALALAALPAAHAQIIPSFGVAGGVNFGSLSDVAGAELQNSTGYHIGLYADAGIGPIAVRPGVFYLSAGDVETGGETVSADFVTIPIDFKFQTPTPIVKGYAAVGPELRFPIGEDGAVVATKSTNVAINFAAGASINPPLVGPSGFIELRYALDVSGFAEVVSDAASDDYNLSLFMVRLGFGL